MVTSDLGACEWFVWDLRRSGLIDRGQLDQVVGEFLKRNPRAEPPSLAEYLVSQNVLSAFQAERILSGKTQGLVLGPYVLMDSIGQGSMGQVYKAASKTDNQHYAVKVLPRRSMWNVRLARRQVRAFTQFTHPTVVPFFDVGTSGGQHYLVWPLAEGEPLEARVNREGRLAPEFAAQVISQVAQGLAISHQHGLFHGLLKPSNIMLGTDGQARLLDFGVGSLLVENEGESLVDTMSTANTLTSGLDCSSPESIMEPTNRTPAGDQYSLGCVLYYCLAGRYPFPDGTAVEKMMAHQFKQPTPIREIVPNLPEGLVAVVEKLMQKSPDSRYAGAEEIVEALAPYTADHLRRPGSVRSAGSSNQGRAHVRSAPAPQAPAYQPTMSNVQAPTQPFGVPTAPQVPAFPSVPTQSAPRLPQVNLNRGAFAASSPLPPAPVYPTPVFPEPSTVPPGNHVTPPAPLPAIRPSQAGTTPGWVEHTRTPTFTPFLIFMIALLVTAVVYLLGKNFLFPQV